MRESVIDPVFRVHLPLWGGLNGIHSTEWSVRDYVCSAILIGNVIK